jgi:hypothetical protein
MDTRFWGPSGWQLLHLIAHDQGSTPAVRELFFNNIKEILPCKFCRASTAEFMETELPLHKRVNDIARWLYELHNRINQKLREQSKTDKNIRDPGPNPSFEEVRDKYTTFLKYAPKQIKVVPGADFMFTLAYNYPETPTSDQVESHMTFWTGLEELYPYPFLREGLRKYIAKNPVYPALQSRSAYMKWVHGLLTKICRTKIRSYRGMCQHVGYFKSACNSPFYRGKTCRRSKDGKYVKLRDNMRTYRITHGRLIV